MKARMPQGFGRPDVNALMRQAQKMQEEVKAKQAELEATEYQGSSGSGMVEVTMTGKQARGRGPGRCGDAGRPDCCRHQRRRARCGRSR